MQLTKRSKCPECDRKLDMATPTDLSSPQAVPTENDVTVCFYCGVIGAYNEDLTIRKATEEDLSKIAESDLVSIRKVQKHARGE